MWFTVRHKTDETMGQNCVELRLTYPSRGTQWGSPSPIITHFKNGLTPFIRTPGCRLLYLGLNKKTEDTMASSVPSIHAIVNGWPFLKNESESIEEKNLLNNIFLYFYSTEKVLFDVIRSDNFSAWESILKSKFEISRRHFAYKAVRKDSLKVSKRINR